MPNNITHSHVLTGHSYIFCEVSVHVFAQRQYYNSIFNSNKPINMNLYDNLVPFLRLIPNSKWWRLVISLSPVWLQTFFYALLKLSLKRDIFFNNWGLGEANSSEPVWIQHLQMVQTAHF